MSSKDIKNAQHKAPDSLLGVFNNIASQWMEHKDYMTEISDENTKYIQENPSEFKRLADSYFNRDTWLLLSEAVPLGFGILPTDWDDLSVKPDSRNYLSYFQADAGHTLIVINPEQPIKKWRIRPSDYHDWLKSKNNFISDAFELAMSSSHELQSDKSINTDKKLHQNSVRFSSERESILAAALYVVLKESDLCRDKGEITIDRIAGAIEEKAHLWFDDAEVPRSHRGIKELLNKSLKTRLDPK